MRAGNFHKVGFHTGILEKNPRRGFFSRKIRSHTQIWNRKIPGKLPECVFQRKYGIKTHDMCFFAGKCLHTHRYGTGRCQEASGVCFSSGESEKKNTPWFFWQGKPLAHPDMEPGDARKISTYPQKCYNLLHFRKSIYNVFQQMI